MNKQTWIPEMNVFSENFVFFTSTKEIIKNKFNADFVIKMSSVHIHTSQSMNLKLLYESCGWIPIMNFNIKLDLNINLGIRFVKGFTMSSVTYQMMQWLAVLM